MIVSEPHIRNSIQPEAQQGLQAFTRLYEQIIRPWCSIYYVGLQYSCKCNSMITVFPEVYSIVSVSSIDLQCKLQITIVLLQYKSGNTIQYCAVFSSTVVNLQYFLKYILQFTTKFYRSTTKTIDNYSISIVLLQNSIDFVSKGCYKLEFDEELNDCYLMRIK